MNIRTEKQAIETISSDVIESLSGKLEIIDLKIQSKEACNFRFFEQG